MRTPSSGEAWYRHGLTMAARANLLFVDQDGRRIGSSLLRFAQTHVEQLACLRPDLPAADDELLSSICRFDILACLVSVDAAGGLGSSVYYPSFSKYYSARSVPAVGSLLERPEMRAALFRGSDEKLAEALRDINETGRREGFMTWDGLYDRRVEQFLETHQPTD